VPDLTEGQDYEFRVIATNAAGQSEPSEPSDIMTAKDRFCKYSQNQKLPVDEVLGILISIEQSSL